MGSILKNFCKDVNIKGITIQGVLNKNLLTN